MSGRQPPELAEFVRLFNAGRYFESHEVLEEVWNLNRSNRFYKALIQMAGALHHWEEASYFWAESLFRGAADLLEPYRPRHAGLEVDGLIQLLRTCADIARAKRRDRDGEYKLPPLVLTLER
ncbi:MAG: DUF309 domain-containing protein [Firmicutes bacterium]|nr:DUF309 domain-containing protein [Bacillota bacterium]